MKPKETGKEVQEKLLKVAINPELDKHAEKDYSPKKTAKAKKHMAATLTFFNDPQTTE